MIPARNEAEGIGSTIGSLLRQTHAGSIRIVLVDDHSSDGPRPLYEFEPDPEALFNALLPKYIGARLFAALLESAASESANRQRAMKAATDNANELIRNLTLESNQARQAQITQEISEIVGGADALVSTGSE